MKRSLSALAVLIGVAFFALRPHPSAAADRTFDFEYAFTVKGLTPSKPARIWIPVAATDAAQDVVITGKNLPADARLRSDASGLNPLYYLEQAAGSDGTIGLSIRYHVTRHEIYALPVRPGEDVSADLKADKLVPVGGRAGTLLDFKSLPTGDEASSRALYDFVFDYMSYSKDKPGWGRGDVRWVCDSRSGNCSDFHSLFLSLCRTAGLPAKMEFGFIVPGSDRPPTVANYHCWAYFKPAAVDHWVPVDISKAKNRPADKDYFYGRLDSDRFGFSTGRDVILSPKQAGPPLNFFVYPYVEVDNQPLPAEQIARNFCVHRPAAAAARATLPNGSN